MKLGWAAGRVLTKNGHGAVLIGKDTRISGYMFESALEAGLSASGADIRLLGPMPTPGVAYLTKSTRAQLGIVISASHNPFYDNGIKFFSSDGSKLSDQVESDIEQELNNTMRSIESRFLGKARRIVDAPRRYIEFCKSRINNIDFNGLRVVVDCANGASYHIAPKVFEELGAEVISYGVSPDGLNINKECGATLPQNLRKLVIENNADIGIALDGDGDRLIMIDHKGNILDGDDILYILAKAYREDLNGAVVGTLMTNFGLEIALNSLQLKLLRTQVGDRYVIEHLNKNKLKLGGETSGHIINLDLTTTGDGIIIALEVLKEMVTTGKKLANLKEGMLKLPQFMNNIQIKNKVDVLSFPELKNAVKEVESILGDKGRVILRASGTEPLVRVMVEGEDKSKIKQLVNQLSEKVNDVLNSQD